MQFRLHMTEEIDAAEIRKRHQSYHTQYSGAHIDNYDMFVRTRVIESLYNDYHIPLDVLTALVEDTLREPACQPETGDGPERIRELGKSDEIEPAIEQKPEQPRRTELESADGVKPEQPDTLSKRAKRRTAVLLLAAIVATKAVACAAACLLQKKSDEIEPAIEQKPEQPSRTKLEPADGVKPEQPDTLSKRAKRRTAVLLPAAKVATKAVACAAACLLQKRKH